MALKPKTFSQIKFLILRHPFTPLFQHSRESVPLFMSINIDQYLHIETLKIWKTPKGPPLKMKKNFVSDFDEIQNMNSYDLRISHIKFEWNRRQKYFSDSKGGPFDDFLKIRKIPKGPPFEKKKFCLRFHSNFLFEILRP